MDGARPRPWRAPARLPRSPPGEARPVRRGRVRDLAAHRHRAHRRPTQETPPLSIPTGRLDVPRAQPPREDLDGQPLQLGRSAGQARPDPRIEGLGAIGHLRDPVLEGHTDAKGTAEYNQRLSEQRAEAVKTWLAEHERLGKTRFVTQGSGAEKPVAPNTRPDGSDDPEGRQKNPPRRGRRPEALSPAAPAVVVPGGGRRVSDADGPAAVGGAAPPRRRRSRRACRGWRTRRSRSAWRPACSRRSTPSAPR